MWLVSTMRHLIYGEQITDAGVIALGKACPALLSNSRLLRKVTDVGYGILLVVIYRKCSIWVISALPFGVWFSLGRRRKGRPATYPLGLE